MTQVSRANGWTVDTKALTLAWNGIEADSDAYKPKPLPDVTLGALVYFEIGRASCRERVLRLV